MTNDSSRAPLLRRGLLYEGITIGWNVIEGAIAITAGVMALSVALIGFGIDSVIETTSGLVVGWRLWYEIRGQSPEKIEKVERWASKAAGSLLLILATYILIDAGRRLLGYGAHAEASPIGIILTAVSLVVMPILGWAKLKTAKALGSGALRADAFETITCAWLSLTTLVGLSLNAAFAWWWADPLAALLLVPLVVREGIEGLRGEETSD